MLIEDVSIIQLWVKSERPNASGADLQECDDPTLFPPDFIGIFPSRLKSDTCK